MGEIPKRSMAAFVAERNPRARRAPLQGTIETTYRCNLACVHCYVNKAVGDAAERAREVPLPRLKQLIDEIAAAGCLEVLLTGGEVLVRPDFEELYLYARSRGLLVIIFTNGTMVTERIADLLADQKPLRVEITLYGMTQETYDRVTQVPGSFEKCMRGIELLQARGVPLKLKTMVLTWNVHELEAMKAFAAERGLEFKFDGVLNARVDCGANRNAELQVDAEKLASLDLEDPEHVDEYKRFAERFKANQAPREELYTCGAGVTSFTIDPAGKLQLCQLSRKHSHDLKTGSFDAGWNEFFPKLRARTWQTNPVCRSCNISALCGNCPGAAELETGNPEAVVASFCRTAHAKAFAAMGTESGHLRDGSCCLGASAPAEASCGACGSCGSKAPALTQLKVDGRAI